MGFGKEDFAKLLPAITITLSLLLAIIPIFTVLHLDPNFPATAVFMFSFNGSQLTAYQQLKSVISQLPSNASVITTEGLLAYVYNRQNVELFQNYTYYFKPEYLLVDFNGYINLEDISGQAAALSSFGQSCKNEYYHVFQNNTAYLLKLNASTANGMPGSEFNCTA